MSKFTIETLEKMFLYLGCANIATQSAMDGAIPLESLTSCGNETVSQFEPALLQNMPINWKTRAVWFYDDTLALSTVCNVHWSIIQAAMSKHVNDLKRRGMINDCVLTANTDGYVEVFYSEINRFGQFEKFRIAKKRIGNVSVSRIFNPSWLLAFMNESMRVIKSPNDDVYKEKRIGFLSPLLCGLAQSVRSYWQVQTKFDEVCPSLTMLTDPTGVKEFWKLRDVPAGKKRREALLHWVSEHWRQTRDDPDVEVYVRKHMRGSEHVSQGQFKAKIVASDTDRLDIEIAKKDREEMREKKVDRRLRSRVLKRKSVTSR